MIDLLLMKKKIEKLLKKAINKLKEQGVLSSNIIPIIKITDNTNLQRGNFSTNLALILSKSAGMNSRVLAKKIIEALPSSIQIVQVKIAGPGFINFFIDESSYQKVISEILKIGKRYGQSELGKGKRIHIEYVSANPTGPLHVGHGRGAAYGACIANLLKAVGFDVQQEYYINDTGRQMGILTLSVWIRYLQSYEMSIKLPENAYQGLYIKKIAEELKIKHGKRFHRSLKSIQEKIHLSDNSEIYLDAWVIAQKNLLGLKDFDYIFHSTLNSILCDIKNDLKEFGVIYDNWFSESRLVCEGLIQEGLELLDKHGYVYKKNGAQWFHATALGDEKDRVLIRKNKLPTYFAADVAYHLYKFNCGYDQIIDVFGADHHGYIPRIRAFLKGLGKEPKKLHTLLVQFAILYRGDKRVSMSTREGTFVTLRELRYEVGNDAARFFYIMRKPDQHLDFDLELAKLKSNENPIYYIQYAHARICSVFRQLNTTYKNWDSLLGMKNLFLLSEDCEKELLVTLARYPEVIKNSAAHYAPHLLAHYLQILANQFHTYYNAKRFLIKDDNLRNARLNLINAIQQIFLNGLALLGVSAPETM